MYLKRHKVQKSWPILRKGTKYIIRPRFDAKKGVPLLIVLRDMLKVVQNRKEAKITIHMRQILINNKPAVDERNGVLLFDVITLVPSKDHFRLELSDKGKFEIREIRENEANHKVLKISGKKMLKNKKIQLNLDDGRNFISDIKCRVNDSVLINFKEKKIEKCLPLKEKTGVVVFAGKHAGKKGNLIKIDENKKIAELKTESGPVNVLIKQLIVVK